MGKALDLIGERFGKLVALEEAGKSKHGHKMWLCQCDCGNKTIVLASNLKIKNTTSCGCFAKELLIKHGMRDSRFYKIWTQIKTRCFNKNVHCYRDYGGRGINICDRWLDFINFRDDMYALYLEHSKQFGENNTSVDRIDVNKNYEPNNCKWSTRIEQAQNKRNNKFFKATSPSGQIFMSKCQSEFARTYKLNNKNISQCLNKKAKTHNGWTFKFIEVDN